MKLYTFLGLAAVWAATAAGAVMLGNPNLYGAAVLATLFIVVLD